MGGGEGFNRRFPRAVSEAPDPDHPLLRDVPDLQPQAAHDFRRVKRGCLRVLQLGISRMPSGRR